MRWPLILGTTAVASVLALPSATVAAEPTGGTLRIVSVAGPNSIDPALAFDPDASALLSATCLPLVRYASRAGKIGTRLVAEAAAAMPRVSSDGRTYTFTLRRNLRFSDGTRITAVNYVKAFNRVADPRMNSPIMLTGAADDIVGMREVARGSARRVRGVTARGRTFRLRLTRPAPDILARLATTAACPVPIGAPSDPGGVVDPPLPGSGPYYISAHRPRREIVLQRNPYYRGSRPRRPAEIRERIGGTLESNTERVERGEADYAVDGPPFARVQELIERYGVNRRQLHFRTAASTALLSMNVTRPLFRSNPRLRRAVAFALDRPEFIRQAGYPLAGRATDQLVPPTMQGFVDRKLFPTARPDLRTARRLARGHLRGGRAVLYSGSTPLAIRRARIVQFNLAEIGLEVEIKVFPPELIYQRAARPREPYDMTIQFWHQDWADPIEFVAPFLHGRSAPTGPTTSIATLKQNLSRFNNRTVNARIDAAGRLPAPRRFAAFGKIEADVLRRYAPIAPIFHGVYISFVSQGVGCVSGNAAAVVDYGALCLGR